MSQFELVMPVRLRLVLLANCFRLINFVFDVYFKASTLGTI